MTDSTTMPKTGLFAAFAEQYNEAEQEEIILYLQKEVYALVDTWKRAEEQVTQKAERAAANQRRQQHADQSLSVWARFQETVKQTAPQTYMLHICEAAQSQRRTELFNKASEREQADKDLWEAINAADQAYKNLREVIEFLVEFNADAYEDWYEELDVPKELPAR